MDGPPGPSCPIQSGIHGHSRPPDVTRNDPGLSNLITPWTPDGLGGDGAYAPYLHSISNRRAEPPPPKSKPTRKQVGHPAV